ncbi:MAG: hypothetical protein IJV12_02515 [Acidaminococcaceae bacterium]|nr:hypothetical protein [Acidaminococcaceae bacterium]
MKKMLAAVAATLLLSGSISGFAVTNTYTDLDSGFRLKAQPAWMEIGGKDFYGLANKPDKKEVSLNLICAFTAKQIEEATDEKFSTNEFKQKYKDLQVLERNGVSPDKVNYLMFMPDPYEIKKDNTLSLLPKELLDNSTIGISTGKQGKNQYVYLHMVDKGDSDTLKKLHRSVDVQLALTSENDMLYAVISTFPLPNLKAQKEEIEEATPFTKKKVRSDLADGNKAKINGYISSRKAFLQGLSFFTPAKDTVPYGFNDALLGGRVKLPEDWAYVQVNDDSVYDKIPLKVTLATPWNGIAEILRNRETENSTEDTTLSLDKDDIKKINFQKISEAAIFASSRTNDKNTFAELFDTPVLTQLVIDKIITEGINHPSVKEYVEFKDLKVNSDFNSNYGKINLTGTGSIKNGFTFNVNANAMFTPDLFGFAGYVSKDIDKLTDQEIEKTIGQIKLIRK